MNAPSAQSETARFSKSLPVVEHFLQAIDLSAYVPLPEGWLVAVTDVVRSRESIAEGRYKAVNMAGAAIISAAMNAFGSYDIPFVFGGDGAAIAIAPAEAETMRRVMAETAAWVRDDLGLTLRCALVPVQDIREAGLDVRLIGLGLSDALHVYGFAGGGTSFAERRMKEGAYAVEAGPPGSRPDLTGLSCRWAPMSADGRRIVSLIVEPNRDRDADFTGIFEEILALARQTDRGGHPVPPAGPPLRWPPDGLDLEARVRRGRGSLFLEKARLFFETLVAWAIVKARRPIGAFDPERYLRYTVLNTDYRKFQDGLRMTLSLTPARLGELRSYLETREREGAIDFGLVEQDSAVITCFVPQYTDDNHFHFLDGAGGGYAEAASRLGH